MKALILWSFLSWGEPGAQDTSKPQGRVGRGSPRKGANRGRERARKLFEVLDFRCAEGEIGAELVAAGLTAALQIDHPGCFFRPSQLF